MLDTGTGASDHALAWRPSLNSKICTRIASSQTVVRDLQTPIVSEVKMSIDDAYTTDVLAGLPYAELPVVAVSGRYNVRGGDTATHLRFQLQEAVLLSYRR